MSLVLYGHPFSSYTQKVLIGLYENDTPFEFRCIGPDTPQHSAEWLRRWPLRKFPLLVDGERTVVESSVILEYLQLAHPGPVRLLPEDPMAALDVRFLDRFFDLHVMNTMQHAVAGALTGDPVKRQEGLASAEEKLQLAYAWLEGQLAGKTWAAGADFTLADCAAAPSLFYADWTYPIAEAFPVLRAYRTRLLARPSFARAVDEARPFRPLFPLGAPDRDLRSAGRFGSLPVRRRPAALRRRALLATPLVPHRPLANPLRRRSWSTSAARANEPSGVAKSARRAADGDHSPDEAGDGDR